MEQFNKIKSKNQERRESMEVKESGLEVIREKLEKFNISDRVVHKNTGLLILLFLLNSKIKLRD